MSNSPSTQNLATEDDLKQATKRTMANIATLIDHQLETICDDDRSPDATAGRIARQEQIMKSLYDLNEPGTWWRSVLNETDATVMVEMNGQSVVPAACEQLPSDQSTKVDENAESQVSSSDLALETLLSEVLSDTQRAVEHLHEDMKSLQYTLPLIKQHNSCLVALAKAKARGDDQEAATIEITRKRNVSTVFEELKSVSKGLSQVQSSIDHMINQDAAKDYLSRR